MRRFARFLSVSMVAIAAASVGAVPAQGQVALPPSLEGEGFFASEATSSTIGSVDVSGECDPAPGETFTLTYEAEGAATGPYPGTFTESGTVTATLTELTVPGFAFGVVTTWNAEFTIDSPVGDVTGTKTLGVSVPFSAFCAGSPAIPGDFDHARGELSYEATIRPATGGTFTDEGEAFASVDHVICQGTGTVFGCPVRFERETFFEFFTLSTGVLPVDTSGKATGGGQVGSLSDPLDQVTFGFNVRRDEEETRLKGTCNVLDHATGTHVKCLTVTDYQQVVNTATWEGTAKVNGVTEDYRITVQDNGEPNQGIDTFSIVTDTYEAAGNVTHGNVQLHKQQLVDAS
jgi:hypothetical protein